MNKIEKIFINEKADNYIVENIIATRSITDILTRFFMNTKHLVWSLLPIGIDEEKILKFENGYIHENHPATKDHIQMCHNLIKSNNDYVWILIDNERDVDQKPELNSINSITKVFYYKDTVFHYLPKELTTIENLTDTFKFGGWYPFIGIITQISSSMESRINQNKIDIEDVEYIIQNIRYMFVGAYDEEGYLIAEFE